MRRLGGATRLRPGLRRCYTEGMRARIAPCLLALTLAALPRPGAALAPPAQPEGKVSNLRVVVRSVQRSQVVSRQFTRDGAFDGAGLYNPLRCTLTLAFEGPTPDDAFRVVALSPTSEILDDRGEPVTASSARIDAPDAAGGSTVSLSLNGVRAGARSLRALDLNVSLVERARMTRVEAPWPSDGRPTRASRDGVMVTLEEARQMEGGLSLVVRVDHPENASLGWNVSTRSGPILLLDARGQVMPVKAVNLLGGEGQTRMRTYRLLYPGVRDTPAKVAATVLVRSAERSTEPLHLENIPLPEFDQPPAEPWTGAVGFLDPASGAGLVSQVLIGGKPAGKGILAVGLRRAALEEGASPAAAEAAADAAWRWVELPTGLDGIARLSGLRPGRYRVRRFWSPSPADRAAASPDPLAWREALVEVRLGDAEQRVLPPLAAPGAARR